MPISRRYSASIAIEGWLDRVWYHGAPSGMILIPFGWLFRALVALRRRLYRSGWLRSEDLPVPVIVVGNISVGGTGKTPFTIWLASELERRGHAPAIVSRGYGGRGGESVLKVSEPLDPALHGDEPVMIARQARVPVFIGRNRVEAAHEATTDGASIIIADDGLQHYRLARDVEIVLVDDSRGHGNGRCLPAGPLREPIARIATVDLVVHQLERRADSDSALSFRLDGHELVSLCGGRTEPLEGWRGRRVYAMAAIGHPDRFFRLLRNAGLDVIEQRLPDHADSASYPLPELDDHPVIVTEKDAVKLATSDHDDLWYLPVRPVISDKHAERILSTVRIKIENKSRRVK